MCLNIVRTMDNLPGYPDGQPGRLSIGKTIGGVKWIISA